MRRILIILLAVLLLLMLKYYLSRGVFAVVTNTGSETINNLILIYTGGESLVGELKPGQSHRVRLHATSESSIELSFLRV